MASYMLLVILACGLGVLAKPKKFEEKYEVESEVEPDLPPPLLASSFKLKGENKNDTNEAMQGDDAYAAYYNNLLSYYYRAPLQAALNSGDQSNQAYEQALQYYYYTAQYPRSALVDYRSAYPYGYGHTLSESQLAWIHSQHPEVRDQYLKDYFGVRPNEANYYGYHWSYPYAR